jgi:hypothetical protein
MNKYRQLEVYLANRMGTYAKLSFDEIEQVIGDSLPKSAYKYQAWWANGGHEHANSWLNSGWRVEQVKFGEWVEFVREG